MKLFSKIYSDLHYYYKKELELNNERETWFMIAFAAASFLIFGWFGLVPSIGAAVKKTEYKNALISTKNLFQTIMENSDKAQFQVDVSQKFAKRFGEIMPQTSNVQTYLEDFVKAVSNDGYIISSLRAFEESENETSLNVELAGSARNLHKLVRSIESLQRITTIKRLNVFENDKETLIQMVTTIYQLPS